jgi:hypothetical protein
MSAGSCLPGRPEPAGRPAGWPESGLSGGGGGGMGTLVTALEGGAADIRPPPPGRLWRRTPFPPAHKNTAFPPFRIPPTVPGGASGAVPPSRRPPGRRLAEPFFPARCHPEGAPAERRGRVPQPSRDLTDRRLEGFFPRHAVILRGAPAGCRGRIPQPARDRRICTSTPPALTAATSRPTAGPAVSSARCHPEGAPAGCRGRVLQPARDRRICTSTPSALAAATSRPTAGCVRQTRAPSVQILRSAPSRGVGRGSCAAPPSE